VRLPLAPGVESLNAAVTAAVCLFRSGPPALARRGCEALHKLVTGGSAVI